MDDESGMGIEAQDGGGKEGGGGGWLRMRGREEL